MTSSNRTNQTGIRRIRVCRMSEIPSLLTFTAIFSLAGTNVAHAYLDPGVGSMLLQIILGGAAGAAVLFRLYWSRFLSVFGMRRQSEEQPFSPQPSSSEPAKK